MSDIIVPQSDVKLCTRNVNLYYGENHALKDINLDIKTNKITAFIGPSGCGKSTLLRMLAGLDFPSAGDIIVNDRKVTGPGPDRGMVFQTYTLFPWMNVEDNIKYE